MYRIYKANNSNISSSYIIEDVKEQLASFTGINTMSYDITCNIKNFWSSAFLTTDNYDYIIGEFNSINEFFKKHPEHLI